MKHYSIGETAKLMGLTTHTLRYWTNEGLITPEYVDPETGYRYYSFNQLHYINRIKYLRDMNIPIPAIREAIRTDSVASLLSFMKEQRDVLNRELTQLQESVAEIDWYIGYFEHPKNFGAIRYPYIRKMPERYAIGTDYQEGDDAETMELRVDEQLARLGMSEVQIHRQWGYIFDYSAFLAGTFRPDNHYMFLKDVPDAQALGKRHPNARFLTFPAGNYLCLMAQLKAEGTDIKALAERFAGFPEHTLILANEFENSFRYVSTAPFEIQLYLGM